MAGACTGLKVLEITRGMAGSFAAMVLGDHGADVIKVESPHEDPYAAEAGFRLWNRSKQRLALDLTDPAQRERALELAQQADVVLLGVRPTAAESWGLTYENLSKDNPGLVFATITGFGWNGPYRDELAIEGMVHALSGSMMVSGNGGFRSGPIYVAPRIASYGAALLCVQGILAALQQRAVAGTGQHVDVSLLQGLLSYRVGALIQPERHQEELLAPQPASDPRGVRPLFNLNQCADGRWVSMAAFTLPFCIKALEVLGLTHVLADPRFAGLPNSFPDDQARRDLLEIIWDAFRKEPQETWLRRMDEQEVPCEPVLSVDEFREHPQLWANDLAVTVADPVVGAMVQPGLLGDLSLTAGAIQPAEPAPRPAAAVQEMLQRWRRAAAPALQRRDGRDGTRVDRGPLSGVKILDFTAFLAGPMCTRLLADLGAEVTKVEPIEGDAYRYGAAAAFMIANRGKRSVALDLKAPETRDAVRRLVAASDVVVYNYRLGVERRLGLDFETLRQIKPDIIVCRMTAFGVKGARAHRPAYDTSIGAVSGMFLEQGGQGNPPAVLYASDISSGLAAATTVLLALHARQTTGKGQSVEATMIGAIAYAMADGFPSYVGKLPRPEVDRGQHGIDPLCRLYPTAGGWLFLAALGEARWRALQGAAGQSELTREAFASPAERQRNAGALTQILAEAFRSRTTAEWTARLRQAGVPCADALVELDRFVMDNPELATYEASVAVQHPHFGRLLLPGAPVRFSRTPCRIDRPEPAVGQHTEEALREIGMTPEEIGALQRAGALAGAAGS